MVPLVTPVRLVMAVALALVACARQTTHQVRSAQPSGFLRDYSQLRPGSEGEAQLVYRAPNADFSRYDKILVEPVAVRGPAERRSDVPAAEVRHLADLLRGTVLSRLRTYYIVVATGGPGVLRLRAALTEAHESSVTLDVLSSIGPVMGAVAGTTEMATGTRAFAGAASVEAELLDTETGEVLMAAVDRRAGTKTLVGATNRWSDVEAAFQEWADRLVTRLQAEGGPRRPLPYWAQPPPR